MKSQTLLFCKRTVATNWLLKKFYYTHRWSPGSFITREAFDCSVHLSVVMCICTGVEYLFLWFLPWVQILSVFMFFLPSCNIWLKFHEVTFCELIQFVFKWSILWAQIHTLALCHHSPSCIFRISLLLYNHSCRCRYRVGFYINYICLLHNFLWCSWRICLYFFISKIQLMLSSEIRIYVMFCVYLYYYIIYTV